MSEIEQKQWKTPFVEDQLVLFDLRWGRGGISIGGEITGDFEIAPETGEEFPALEVSVFSLETQSVYKVSFASVLGFRVIDSDDFIDMLSAAGFRAGESTFMVRHESSPLSVLSTVENGAWSYVIATEVDCLEVAAMSDDGVAIEFVREVERVPRKWMGVFQRD